MRSGMSSGNGGYDSVFSRRSPPPRSGNGMSRFRYVKRSSFQICLMAISIIYSALHPLTVHTRTSVVIHSMIVA